MAFGTQGYQVVAVGRDIEALAETERLVLVAGGEAMSVTCDAAIRAL